MNSGIEKKLPATAAHGEIVYTSSCWSFTKEAMVSPPQQQSLLVLRTHDCTYVGDPYLMQ